MPRDEYEALERRVLRAEQHLRQQDAAIKILQARLDAMPGMVPNGYDGWGGGGGGGYGYVDRSRTPPPRGMAQRPTGVPPVPRDPRRSMMTAQTAQEFATENGLDEKCLEALCNQPYDIQQHVISQGPVEGRNPSAMVMARIAKCGGVSSSGGGYEASFKDKVEEFIAANGLDEKCGDALRNQSPDCQMAVINLGPADGRNPSAMVMGRIAKCSGAPGSGGGAYTETPMDKVEEFIATNGVDEKCGDALRNQSPDCQMAVINLGPADGRNPSAMVMGRIAKYQRSEL